MNNLQLLLKCDPHFDSLSSALRAAVVSSSLALKDAMTVSSQLQANLMLLQRDKFLAKMQPRLLNAKQNVLDDFRTAPFAGPLIPDSLVDSFSDVLNAQPAVSQQF